MYKQALIFLFCAHLLTGCATIHTRISETSYSDSLYPATQQDLEWFDDSELPVVGRILLIPDLAPSLVFDTVLIPVDYFF